MINSEAAAFEERKVSQTIKASASKSLLPYTLLLKMSKRIPIHPQHVMDRFSQYRTEDGDSLLHVAVEANNKDAVNMLLKNGFQMYQART